MKKSLPNFVFAAFFFGLQFFMFGSAMAQHFSTDLHEEHLKGSVKSVLTTTRTPQGRIVGQPVRQNFNLRGYISQKTYYDTMGLPVFVVTYSYDKKDRLVNVARTQEPFSEPLSQTSYNYNGKNRTIVAEMVYATDSSLIERSLFRFDKKNNLLSVTSFNELNKQTDSISYEHNNLGYISFATYTEGENHIYKGGTKYRYDTDGFLAEQCSYYLTSLRQAFLYTYLYDEYGNWIQAFVYHVTPTEGFLYQVISRQISYYE